MDQGLCRRPRLVRGLGRRSGGLDVGEFANQGAHQRRNGGQLESELHRLAVRAVAARNACRRSRSGCFYKAIFTARPFVALYRPLVWLVPSIPRHLGRPLAAFLDRAAQGFILFLIVGALAALLLPTTTIARFRTEDAYKRIVLGIKRKYAPLGFALLLPFLVLSFGSHYLFNIRDSFGSFCEGTPGSAGRPRHQRFQPWPENLHGGQPRELSASGRRRAGARLPSWRQLHRQGDETSTPAKSAPPPACSLKRTPDTT